MSHVHKSNRYDLIGMFTYISRYLDDIIIYHRYPEFGTIFLIYIQQHLRLVRRLGSRKPV